MLTARHEEEEVEPEEEALDIEELEYGDEVAPSTSSNAHSLVHCSSGLNIGRS